MKLPDHLSAEAAMALFELVTDLERAIWDKYEQILVPLCIAENRRDAASAIEDEPELHLLEDFNDPVPF